jgi:uncharacterized membrane protein HdeD (DUF308 family)
MTEFTNQVKAGIKDEVKAGGNRMRIFGVIAIILGILCLLAPGLTGVWALTLMGLFVLAAGIVRMIWAFQAGSFGKGLLMFAIGGLTLLCGIALVANPLFASGVLTVMLAVYFIFDGISEIVGGFRLRPGSGWGWMLFAGLLTLVFWGAIIALVVWGIKKVTEREDSRPKSTEKRDALDIAKERYAKGEISREEFEQIKKDLS